MELLSLVTFGKNPGALHTAQSTVRDSYLRRERMGRWEEAERKEDDRRKEKRKKKWRSWGSRKERKDKGKNNKLQCDQDWNFLNWDKKPLCSGLADFSAFFVRAYLGSTLLLYFPSIFLLCFYSVSPESLPLCFPSIPSLLFPQHPSPLFPQHPFSSVSLESLPLCFPSILLRCASLTHQLNREGI